jgi:hypothetical protein
MESWFVENKIILLFLLTENYFLECQFCGKRYSRKDSLKHHIKTQHTQFVIPNWIWKEKNQLLDGQEHMENDDVVLVT